MKTLKTFDCVDMKQRGAERVRLHLAGKSPREELEYWRQRTEQLRRQQAELRDRHGQT